MRSHYEIKNTLKNLPFYSEKTNNIKKTKKLTNTKFLSELPFSPKKIKKLSNYQLSKELPLFPKRPKRPKNLTKHLILKNILPLYNSVGISKRQRAFRGCAESYNVEVADRESLNDSLFS